jgi:hypothetical protein
LSIASFILEINTVHSIPDLYIASDKKTLTSSDSEKANVLADCFSSVFTEEDDLVMPELDINPYIPKLDILNISTARLLTRDITGCHYT